MSHFWKFLCLKAFSFKVLNDKWINSYWVHLGKEKIDCRIATKLIDCFMYLFVDQISKNQRYTMLFLAPQLHVSSSNVQHNSDRESWTYYMLQFYLTATKKGPSWDSNLSHLTVRWEPYPQCTAAPHILTANANFRWLLLFVIAYSLFVCVFILHIYGTKTLSAPWRKNDLHPS